MTWIEILIIVLAVIAHIVIGYAIPHIKRKNNYLKIKEFHEIIKKENKDE